MHEFLTLDRYKDTLGDPSKYFLDSQVAVPRIVEHATGQPKFVIDTHGTLRPFGDLVAGTIDPADLPRHIPQPHVYEFGPRPAAKPLGINAEAAPGKFTGSVHVS